MRILHLDSGREMGGGQWQVLRLIEGLGAAGVESTLLAREDGALFGRAKATGCRVEALGLSRTALLSRTHEVVHAHDARGHTLAALVRLAPVVVSRRVAFPIRSRWKYGRADCYLAVSQFVAAELARAGVPEAKIRVVPDGVPVLPLSTREGGVIAPANKMPAGVECRGSNDLERDLQGASIFVYYTECEGLGSAVLMAMSAGVPVVASRVGGLPEVLRDGENGLLVQNQAAEFRAAVARLRGDPELAARIGAAARQTVLNGFTVDHMVRRTMESYRQVLK
jgi:hypothetical protein